jgi:hypothetical protein
VTATYRLWLPGWLLAGFLIIAGCLGTVVWYNLTTRWADEASVGECLTSTGVNGSNANGVEVVACDSAKAAYRVIGFSSGYRILSDGVQSLNDPTCAEFPETTASLYIPDQSKSLCLVEIR